MVVGASPPRALSLGVSFPGPPSTLCLSVFPPAVTSVSPIEAFAAHLGGLDRSMPCECRIDQGLIPLRPRARPLDNTQTADPTSQTPSCDAATPGTPSHTITKMREKSAGHNGPLKSESTRTVEDHGVTSSGPRWQTQRADQIRPSSSAHRAHGRCQQSVELYVTIADQFRAFNHVQVANRGVSVLDLLAIPARARASVD